MNLILDFGNTCIKAAVFKGRELTLRKVFESEGELLKEQSLYKNIKHCIIGSVTDQHREFISAHQNDFKIIEFTAQSKVPLRNLYQSVSTLGSDRLAASVGAWTLYPNANVLVIDAGTCLKFNFTSAANEYLGGAISPGLQMRFRALEHFTGKLPLINVKSDFDKLIGRSTEESILSGVINGILAEAEAGIEAYRKLYPDIKIVITGGDAPFFVNRLKNSIFANQNLVPMGLNEVLMLNS